MDSVRVFYNSLLCFPKILNGLGWLNRFYVFEIIATLGALLVDVRRGNRLSLQRLLFVGGGTCAVARTITSMVKNHFHSYTNPKPDPSPAPNPAPQTSSPPSSLPDWPSLFAELSSIPESSSFAQSLPCVAQLFDFLGNSEISEDLPLIQEIERLLPEEHPLRLQLNVAYSEPFVRNLLQHSMNQLSAPQILCGILEQERALRDPPPTPDQILEDILAEFFR